MDLFLGTVSVDPNLENQEHQLIIRHSMLKFTSDHDQLEICKVSSPRMFNEYSIFISLFYCSLRSSLSQSSRYSAAI